MGLLVLDRTQQRIDTPETTTVREENFQPPGMIPEFNAWGNHPENLFRYLQTHARQAYERLGIADKYPEAEEIFSEVLDELAKRPQQFTGHHMPTPAMHRLLDHCMSTFIRAERCTFSGFEHYQEALEITSEGKNVIITPNHSSPLDALVPLTLISEQFPGSTLPSLVMSQVFEYARITGLLTSGVEKFPVFQPKHIQKFAETGKESAVIQMRTQNIATLRALSQEVRKGGNKTFLYLERDRNSDAMGVPEPEVVRLLELLDRAGGDLYILPMHISGIESIFPNRPDINELDVFFETILIGQGTVSCGKPIPFSKISEAAESIDQSQLVEKVLGIKIDDKKELRLATISILTLGLTASMAPNNEAKGIYGKPDLAEIVTELKS